MTVLLIDETFGTKGEVTGRSLVLEGERMVVKTGCCFANFKNNDKAKMMACVECGTVLEPFPEHGSPWTASVGLDIFREMAPSLEVWNEWFEYWFKVPDMSFTVEWEE